RIIPALTPEVAVGVTPIGGTSPTRAVIFGAERFSPGNLLRQKIFEVSDNFTASLGSHTITLGGRYEKNYIYNFFQSGLGGAYVFRDIAALAAGTPTGYLFAYANSGSIAAEFNGQTIAGYAQDIWSVTRNLSVTYGLRVDVPSFLDSPKLNQDILTRSTAAGLPMRTDSKPKTQALMSPRAGFNWNVGGAGITQLRGTVGVFTAPVPYIFVGNAYSNTGLGGVVVTCTGANTPAYVSDPAQLPKSCLNSAAPTPGAAGTSGINLTDPNFKNPQNLTSSFGIDRRLPWDVLLTGEALYRKSINGIFTQDLNLRGPRQAASGGDLTTSRGRTIYADTITVSATGSYAVNNNTQRRILQTGSNNVNFTDGAIYLTNQSADYSYSLTGQLKKRFGRTIELNGAYTYMQAKDVQSLTSDRAVSNYRNGRQPIGRIEDNTTVGTSYFERPNRVTLSGTYTAPWSNAQTDVSFFYEGISGSPITYVVSQDINGDGVTSNDPIYIPRNAADVAEFRIGTGSGAAFATNPAAAADFERFISEQKCLSEHRGSIMERNSCTTPWQTRFDMSVRQSLPRVAGQNLTLQLDIFNMANLLNRNWGTVKLPPVSANFPQQAIFNVRQRSAGPLTDESLLGYELDTRFRGTATNPTPALFGRIPGQSRDFYQVQMSLRYAF
ncbi:MAG: hypothetical protein ABIW79_10180, partial [Gemmatimonas sp.]